MFEGSMDLTPTVVKPHGLAQLVRCPLCGAAVGSPCVTHAAGVALHGHRRRWDASSGSAGRDLALFEAKTDDDEGRAGDVLVAKAYRLENEKVTVLRVLRSGRDPERNAYRRDLRVLRVLTVDEAGPFT